GGRPSSYPRSRRPFARRGWRTATRRSRPAHAPAQAPPHQRRAPTGVARTGAWMPGAAFLGRGRAGPGSRDPAVYPVVGLRWAATATTSPRAHRPLWLNWRERRRRWRAVYAST